MGAQINFMSAGRKNVTGYRLHKERLLFSGGQAVRTIKFPLVPFIDTKDNLKFLKQFEEAVISDDLRIRGDLNINDYLEYTVREKPIYTLFDFWIDSLRAGVIWDSKPSNLIDFVRPLFGISSPVDIVWEKSSNNLKSFFDKEKFKKEVILSDSVRSRSTKDSFKKRLAKCLLPQYIEGKGKSVYVINSKKAQETIDFTVNSFFDNNGNLKLNKQAQEKFWKENFNLDKSVIEEAKPKGFTKNITFLIVPELIEIGAELISPGQLVAKRFDWLERMGVDEKDSLERVLGLADNFNGFSNYLGKVRKYLQENKTEELYEALNKILPNLENDKDKIILALNFLAKRSKLLQDPSLPLLSSWADYRSVFGGKLQSWFSNFTQRERELDGQIAKFQMSLKQVKNYLQNEKFGQEAEKEKKDILELIDILERFFTNEEKSIKKEENYLLFSSLLALVKRRLNFFYQAHIQKEGEETKVNQFKPLKGFYEQIYKPVAFYGVSARRANEKFVYKTIPILEDGIENVKKLAKYLEGSFSPKDTFKKAKKDKETPEDAFRKALQFFWNKHRERMLNSSEFRAKCEKLLRENTGDKEWQELQKKENKGRYVYYRSRYAKGSLKKVKLQDQDGLKDKDYLDKLNTLYSFLVNDFLSYNKNELLTDEKILLDWIELARHTTGVLLRFNTKNAFKLQGLALNNFEQAKKYAKLFPKNQYSKNEYSFIVQSFIFSEIRGAATLYSKKDYTARYSVQVVGSDQKFQLHYHPKEKNIALSEKLATNLPYSEEKEQLMQPHHYTVSLGRISKKKTENFNAITLGKNILSPVLISDEAKNKLLRLSSSPYQLQFLDKFLCRPKGWEDIDISLSEWSFVVEKRYKIQWNLNAKKPKLLPVTEGKEAKKNKLYVAIPFNLKPNKNRQKEAILKEIAKGKEKEEKDLSRLSYPILGVDVGEYGLAYCLVRFDYDKKTFKVKALEMVEDEKGKPIYGFIEDKNIANIKDKFAEIQQRAKQGAFDEEDTTVARVRENAIGRLRNKIHVIIASGSSVVYEDSISNFETGSGRTTKIYNSVKRADTEHTSKADKAVHTHVWGENTKWVGRNVSAYASSYTCVKCLHSLYEIKKKNLSSMEIKGINGRIITITTPDGDIQGYLSEKNKYKKGYQFKATKDELNSFRKIVRDFTRPPVSKNSEVLEKFTKKLLENKINKFRKRRGNSAIFVCPFCHFVTDADIQAAFMMAIRGYLRFSGIVPSQSKDKKQNKGKTAGKSFLKKTKEVLESIDRDEIIGTLSLGL